MQSQLKCLHSSQGPQNSWSTIFRKKILFFLKFFGPVTPPWVLYRSEIMYRDSTGSSLVRAVFALSIKVFGWKPGPQNPGSTTFRKKTARFFEIHRTSVNSVGSVALRNHSYGFTGPLLARAVFARSIKVHGLQPGAPKSREHDFPKKKRPFFEFHRTSDTSMGSVSL